MCCSSDAGATFTPPVKVSDAPGWRMTPSSTRTSRSTGEIVVAWQAFANGDDDAAAMWLFARFTHDGVKHGARPAWTIGRLRWLLAARVYS